MTKLDDRLIPKAYELTEKYGQQAVFTTDELLQANYDPTTGHVTPAMPTNSVRKVTPPIDYDQYFSQKYKDLIEFGDLIAFLPAQDLAPSE